MAKWGEGDPRWIVEERPDATNPHNWHWTEKNATPWSKDRFDALFVGAVIESGPIKITVTEIKKAAGEAVANNRKGKLIFLFEWDIELLWEARIGGSMVTYDGIVNIPNLSDENTAEEVDFNVEVYSKDDEVEKVRHLMKTKGTDFLRSRVEIYLKELKEEFSEGMILPTQKTTNKNKSVLNKDVLDKKQFQDKVITSTPEGKERKVKDEEKRKLQFREKFKLPPEKMWEVLTEAQFIQRWSNCACKIEAKEGGEFSFFNGMVSGKFTKLVKDERIEMQWRLKSYPSGYFVDLRFKLIDEGDRTDLDVLAKGVPNANYDETENGLRRHYMQNIMRTFGLGGQLF